MRDRASAAVAGPLAALFRSGAVGALDDEALLDRFAGRRDEAAFEALVLRHGPMVLRVCRSILPDEHDARDAYQATFLTLARRAGSIRRRASLGPWLFGVARRVALKARLAARRRRFHERNAARRPEAMSDRPPEMLPEVLEEVARLPDRLRAPVVLCDLQGHSYESAARLIGCPTRTVHSRLRTARDRLRRRLTARGLAPALSASGWLTSGSAEASALACAASSAPLARLATAIASGPFPPAGAVPASVLTLVLGGPQAMLVPALKATTAACLLLIGASGLVPFSTGPGDEDGADHRTSAAAPSPLPEAEERPATFGPPVDRTGPGPSSAPIRLGWGSSLRRDASRSEPWTTVVRIKVHGNSFGLGSGTVIGSTEDEAIILTCAHIFGVDDPQPKPDQFHRMYPVRVELFDGRLTGPGGTTVRPLGDPMPGEVIDYDFDRDVAILRIRPGRVVPASRVVPRHWTPKYRMAMVATGCSYGEDATAWSTMIVEPESSWQIPGKRHYAAIKCQHSPFPGRAGGGLFTEDGYLAGVCNFSLDREVADAGLYAAPESIHHLLDRNGLSHLYEAPSDGPSPSDRDDGSRVLVPLPDRGSAAPPVVEPDVWSPPPSGAEGDRLERRRDRVTDAIEDRPPAPAPSGPPDGEPPPVPRPDAPEPRPGLRPHATWPRPLETVVRIKPRTVRVDLGFGSGAMLQNFGSGTVIHSTPEESIILTCARIFEFHQPKASPEPINRGLSISVELFDEADRTVGTPIPGEVIDCDFDRDVALVRIRPGRELKASPIVPPGWSPQAGMSMIAVGCSPGADATAWSTTITDPESPYRLPGKRDYAAIQCRFSPKPGRTGGGLFTTDGLLAGVCNFAFDRAVDAGLYAAPRSIYALLDRNGLAHLYKSPAPGAGAAEATASTPTELPPPGPQAGGRDLSMIAFLADWSAPSRSFAPQVDRLRQAGYPIRAVKIDEDPALAGRLAVDSVPTVLLLDAGGHEVQRLSGDRSASEIARFYRAVAGEPGFEVIPPPISAASDPISGRIGPALTHNGQADPQPERIPGSTGNEAEDRGRPSAVEDAFRSSLRALLRSGPVRLASEGEVEVSIRLDDPGDLDRADPILDALFSLGQPVRVEPESPGP